MNIDTFLHEIEDRKKNDIEKLDKEFNDGKSETELKKSTTIKELQEQYSKYEKTKS